jgi:hypothetical protein
MKQEGVVGGNNITRIVLVNTHPPPQFLESHNILFIQTAVVSANIRESLLGSR